MSNPFSGSEIPGMNAMGDTLSFVKKLWGNMQVPGMVAPPMSLDELDKKIQDLKTVESWLTVNMNMLRGTIQALEVQRATIAALQSLGESFAQHAQQAGAMAEQAASAASSHAGSNADWPMHPQAAKTAAPEPEPAVEDEEDVAEDDDMVDVPPDTAAENVKPATEETVVQAGTAGDSSAAFVNPAAWWGLLQEQFKQAVSKAMESEPAVSSSDEAKKTAKKTAKTTRPARKSPAAKPAKTSAEAKSKVASKAATVKKPTAKKTVAKPGAAARPSAKTTKAR